MGDTDVIRRIPGDLLRRVEPLSIHVHRFPRPSVSGLMFALIVFDLDGTLVDSKRDIADSANALLVACGAEPLAEDRLAGMVGDGAATLVARAFEAAGLARPSDALARYLAFYETRQLAHTRPYPGVVDVLDDLQSKAKLAVLTNKPLAATRAVLEGLGLARYFEVGAVIGGDGPFPRKPDATALRYLMSSAGVSPDATLHVDDAVGGGAVFSVWLPRRPASGVPAGG